MPQPSIVPWELGQDLAVVTVTIQTVNPANGNLTNGATFLVTGLVQSLKHTVRRQGRDLRPVTRTQENQVPVSVGNGLRLAVLRLSQQANGLISAYQQGVWVLVGWVQGQPPGTAHGEQYGIYFVMMDAENGTDGAGEQVFILDMAPCDPNVAQGVRTVL